MQALTNIYTLNIDRNEIQDTWHVESGVAPNLKSWAGTYTFNPTTYRKLEALPFFH